MPTDTPHGPDEPGRSDEPAEPAGSAGASGPADRARLLCDVRALAAETPAERGGAVWRLDEPGRQLDSNLVHLPPGRRVDTHAEPDLDVLLLGVDGSGVLDTPDGPVPLAPGSLVWLPHGSTRALTAGERGLVYLTVHRRRPGMQIRTRPGG
ncbi:cupin domain-containing protein [Streptomyces sp. HB2AG]|uniref:cupin domain-containing protein n=1 Tax=Streptomyces sp. HB2AG TaxID=2983400 RepID=UPI0022AAA839|nr:hypothetical protein [Streptomyces sp. HB2AG]MCZ2524792.1 hypothetical protein [Streptomyces sp. HB2AG]